MNKEYIEDAAAEYRNDVLCDVALEVNFEENNYDAGYSDCIAEEIPKAFAKGAEWRINSVWHDKADVPEVNKEFLVELRNDDSNPEYWIEDYDKEYHALSNSGIDWEEVVRWAYLEDLLPERKEGEK